MVIAKMVGVFYEKRKTSYKIMSLSILSTYIMFVFVFIFLLNRYPDWLVIEFPTIFIGCFIMTLNYESSIARRLTAAFSTFTIIVFLVLLIGGTTPFLFPTLQFGDARWVTVTNILLIPIGYLMAALISRFKNIRKMAVFPRIALIAPLTGAVIMIVLFTAGIASTFGIDIVEEIGIIMVLIFLAWLIFSNFFLFDILSAKYEDKLKSERQAQEKEYYYTQCQLMQESAEQIKAVRHDIKIHLAALRDFTTNGSIEDIKNYLDTLVKDIEKSEIYSNTGNIAFDSIINYKLRNAKNENIKLDLNVAVPPELNVEVADIVTVIGNLLDNALEAVAKVNEKIIKLDINFNKGGLFIKIENSFNGEVKYDEDTIISLKNGLEHGYGLKNIRKSVEKYNGHMKISYTESIFSTGVFLYVSGR